MDLAQTSTSLCWLPEISIQLRCKSVLVSHSAVQDIKTEGHTRPQSLHFCLCVCISNLTGFCGQVMAWGLTHPQSTLRSRDMETWVTDVQVHSLRKPHSELVKKKWIAPVALHCICKTLKAALGNYLTAKLPPRSPLIHQGRLAIM